MSLEFYSYLDDLLSLQSNAADRHNHKGVLGSVREDFLRKILKESIDDINIHTGEVTSTTRDLGQHDIVIRRRGTVNTELGGSVRLPATDCSAVIEVKSNAKGTEITSFDEKAKLIKEDNSQAVCGMVCYKIRCKKETILKRFGFVFDSDIEGFIKSDCPPTINQYEWIDFILCLDGEEENTHGQLHSKAFFIKKSSEYELFLKPPFTQYFLMEINRVKIERNE